MSWIPISGVPTQLQKSDGTLASGYYLKAYEAGTTNPLSMATDSTGGTTLAKCQINSSGYPITAGSAVFVPHLSQDYKIVLYKNSTDADADTTGNADWVVDNVSVYEVGSDEVWGTFAGAPTQTSAITFTLTGDQTSTFSVGTKLKLTDASTIYGIVTAVAYSSVTTVTVLATADLSGSLSAVEYAKTYDDGQTKGLVLDARTYVVTASRTIANDFVIPKGCLLSISSSQTLTISGSLEAGLYQIFSGSGVVRGFDASTVHPEWWGAVADGSTDDKSSIMAMFAYAEAKTSGGSGCSIKFQPKIYGISGNITYKGSNTIISGYGTTIDNNYGIAGYITDGIVIGNKDSADGEDGTNTSPFTYSENVHVKGFKFKNCRIGAYYVFCKSCSAQDLESDGVSCVAWGNDANNSPCYDMYAKNIRQSEFDIASVPSGEAFYIIGLFTVTRFVIDGVFSREANMGGGASANTKQITIRNSHYGLVKNFTLDQVDKLSGGFEIASSSTYVTFCDGIVRRCLLGGTFFDNYNAYCTLDNVVFDDCVDSFNLTSSSNVVRNCRMIGSDTNDLYVSTNANDNLLMLNTFESDLVTEQVSGGLAAQSWINNFGGPNGISLSNGLGTSIDNAPIVIGTLSSATANATGDNTAFVLSPFTGGDFADQLNETTGLFTCHSIPTVFKFSATCVVNNLTASSATLVTASYRYNGGASTVFWRTTDITDEVWLDGSFVIGLNAGDTIEILITASGGTKVAGIATPGTFTAIPVPR